MTTRAPIVLVAAVGLLALAGCNQYDQLIAKDQTCDARWADYQAQLQRRSDLVPNLVATVKASAQHEEKTLSEVTEARARATGITLSAEDLQDPEKVAAFQKAQDQLRGALSRLLVANEAYPDLKANAQFHDLSVQLERHREPRPPVAGAVQRGRAGLQHRARQDPGRRREARHRRDLQAAGLLPGFIGRQQAPKVTF